MSDTIAAISTGAVLAGIGVIRLSGPGALRAADAVFTPDRGAPMSRRPDRLLVLGTLRDRSGAVIDRCLCTVSRAPHSYTGEHTAELQCHGAPVVLREALEALFAAGARQALPGEFTKRAFLNGRMDLTQAEAVIDLIEAETAEAARNAAGQLGGTLGRKTDGVYLLLRDISSHYHAVIDYPDEDIEDFRLADYDARLAEAEALLRALHGSFARGKVLTGGVPTAIVGRPNVGKSTLMNALLGYERAIVTDLPGTTRDTLTERLRLGGVLLRLTDTAGIREAEDAVERQGVARAQRALAEAELVLLLTDAAGLTPEDQALLDAVEQTGTPWLLLRNKTDTLAKPPSPSGAAPGACAPDARQGLPAADAGFRDMQHPAQPPQHPSAAGTEPDRSVAGRPEARRAWRHAPAEILDISAKTGAGLDALEAAVSRLFPLPAVPAGEILTNARQAEAVGRAKQCVEEARAAMTGGFPPDAVLTLTEEAMEALGALTGRSVREDITQGIFARFCVGK